jgi:hypothetical protein
MISLRAREEDYRILLGDFILVGRGISSLPFAGFDGYVYEEVRELGLELGMEGP